MEDRIRKMLIDLPKLDWDIVYVNGSESLFEKVTGEGLSAVASLAGIKVVTNKYIPENIMIMVGRTCKNCGKTFNVMQRCAAPGTSLLCVPNTVMVKLEDEDV